MTTCTQVAFHNHHYRDIVRNLDAVLNFMKEEFGKNEEEAQAWMRDFIVGHYFPVWRAMNRTDGETADGEKSNG